MCNSNFRVGEVNQSFLKQFIATQQNGFFGSYSQLSVSMMMLYNSIVSTNFILQKYDLLRFLVNVQLFS